MLANRKSWFCTFCSNTNSWQMLLASEIMVCVGVLLSFHVIGVNLSLLSRVMSSRLSRGTYNGGLLSTEAGTIARVIADATITLAGFLGESRLLNITLIPSLLICIFSIIFTCRTYNSLY
ncbi:hypothetical protein RHGRI_020056 [Rhododendron griersonianum]|uniref:Uncharacterized protein n=1 Tax=Rhododendron griersonianum TaxID=479676 RepID=A0AAV6JJW2_9ERIC|nr:hypothetical protein RHGRI_020056 [Rhododendron griersonianum]